MNGAPGGHGAEWLFFFCGVIQRYLHIILGAFSGHENAQDLIKAIQAQQGKIHGKGLVIFQIAEALITGQQVVKMCGTRTPESKNDLAYGYGLNECQALGRALTRASLIYRKRRCED